MACYDANGKRPLTPQLRTAHWGFVLGLLAAFGFASMGGFIRLLPQGTPTSLVLFIRGVAIIVTLAWASADSVRSLTRNDLLWITSRAVMLGAANYCSLWTVPRSSVATARSLSDLSVIIVALIELARGRSRVDVRIVLALCLSLAGLCLLWHVSSGNRLASGILSVGTVGAVCGALGYIALGEASVRASASSVVVAYGIVLMSISPFVPDVRWTVPSDRVWLLLCSIGLTAAAAQWLLTASFRRLDTTSASFLGLTTVPFALGIDFAVAGTIPTRRQTFAYLLLLGAAGLIGGRPRNHRSEK